MMKQYSNEEIFNIYKKLENFYKNNRSQMPISFVFCLERNVQSIEPVYNAIIKTAVELDTRYEDKQSEEYKQAYKDFSEMENTIDIRFYSLKDLKDVKLTWKDYQAIDFMMED